jgi:hypothetical protein
MNGHHTSFVKLLRIEALAMLQAIVFGIAPVRDCATVAGYCPANN